jgi:hypothetical protein
MKTPPTFVVFRVTAVTITVLVLLLLGLGLSGRGPLDGLGRITGHASTWLRVNAEVSAR